MTTKLRTDTLPPLPSKRYFTMGEVSKLCAVEPHVLRYWEQTFPQLEPNKRRGRRRYYEREDIMRVREIRVLLFEKGFTIQGARRQLSLQVPVTLRPAQTDPFISNIIVELESLLAFLAI